MNDDSKNDSTTKNCTDTNNDNNNNNTTTWDDLLDNVQASPLEIARALIDRNAICLDGQWRLVDPGYLGTILDLLLLTLIEQGWTLHAVPAEDAAYALQCHGIPQELTFHCIKTFSDHSVSTSHEDEGEHLLCLNGPEQKPLHGTLCLCEKKVCRFLGIRLLIEEPSWKSVEEFMTAWRKIVPEVRSVLYWIVD